MTTETETETKEIDSCLSCPMLFAERYICTHWGSPEGIRLDSFVRKPPVWCPLRSKSLLLKVIE